MFEIGNSLREARHRQQLELSEIEQATKIRSRYLRALEEESFDVLPAQTYVKGFLRTYADYLGLDGQLYVDEYNSRYGVEDEPPREPVVARRTSTVRRHQHRFERRGVILALAGIGALFALVIAAWKFSDNGPQQPLGNLGQTTSTAKKKPKVTAPLRQTTPRRPASFRLYLSATHGNCWMDVRNWSANGRSRYTGTLELGQGQRFVARKLWINFGAPGNLSVALNGKAVTIPGGGTYPVLVTPTGIKRASATA